MSSSECTNRIIWRTKKRSDKKKAGIPKRKSRQYYENRNQTLKKKDCEIVVEKCSPYKVRN